MSLKKQTSLAHVRHFGASCSSNRPQISSSALADFLPRFRKMVPRHSRIERPSNHTEILIGRTLAFSVHPNAAWRVLPASGRLWMVCGYFATAYLTVLSGLFLLSY